MSRNNSSSSSDTSTDSNTDRLEIVKTSPSRIPTDQQQTEDPKMLGERPVKRGGKRPGRKPSKIDVKAKLERSRQSARECRARKKLRYQYLEELVLNREQAIFSLRDELEVFKQWCIQVDKGIVSDKLLSALQEEQPRDPQTHQTQGTPTIGASRGPRQTSTVTSSTQSLYKSTSVEEIPSLREFGSSTRSRSFEYPPTNYGSTPGFDRSISSHLHGSGVQVHAGLPYDPRSGQYGGSMVDTMYSGQGHYDYGTQGSHGSPMNYQTPVTTSSQGFISLSNMSAVPEDPVTTLSSITNPGSVLPTYDMAVMYNQPSTSQGPTTEASSWYSLLAELEPGLARQEAESASGTPQSVDGVRSLPTVLHEFADTDSSSDT